MIMPPKKDKSRKPRKMPPKDTEEYLHRRERNNVAVQKSREKSRQKAKETIDRVERLKTENEELEQQVKILAKELGVLKDLFKMVHPTDSGGRCAAADTGIQTDNATAVHTILKPPELEDVALPDNPNDPDVIINIEPANEETVETQNTGYNSGADVNFVALSKDHEYIASPKSFS